MEYHKDYIEKLGKPIAEAWDFDLRWGTNDGPIHWPHQGRVTDMGHAEYAADGSDLRAGRSVLLKMSRRSTPLTRSRSMG
jgi:hypothetical protein